VALGGGKKRKSLRAIEVDRKRYYWRIVDDETVAIGVAERPHCRVMLRDPGGLSSTSVTPRMIREAILFARSNGWPHARATLAVAYTADRFVVSASSKD
jgi:hypothetical protein